MTRSLWVSGCIYLPTCNLRLPVTPPAGYFCDVEGCLLETGAVSINQQHILDADEQPLYCKTFGHQRSGSDSNQSSWMQAALLYSSDGANDFFYVRPEWGRREESTLHWYFEHIYILFFYTHKKEQNKHFPPFRCILPGIKHSSWSFSCVEGLPLLSVREGLCWRLKNIPSPRVGAGRLWLTLCPPVSLMRKTWWYQKASSYRM